MVNSTLMAAIIYHMLALDLPQWFLNYADKPRWAFFWCGQSDAKEGSRLVAWHVVCTPKHDGGLGVHNVRLMNLALCYRWCFLEMNADDKPWAELPIEIPKEAESVFLAATRCNQVDGRRLNGSVHG